MLPIVTLACLRAQGDPARLLEELDLVQLLVHYRDMIEFNVHEAKTHLSRLLARVEAGEEILISRAGHPVARLVPARKARGKRRPGRFVGKGRIADDFNAPLPPEVLAGFLK